jgi:hypothetical protein
MNIQQYSDKSFVIIGSDTKEHKEKIKAIGGKWNANLKCGGGWIFHDTEINRAKAVQLIDSIYDPEPIQYSRNKSNSSAFSSNTTDQKKKILFAGNAVGSFVGGLVQGFSSAFVEEYESDSDDEIPILRLKYK